MNDFKYASKTTVHHKYNKENGFTILKCVVDVHTAEQFYLVAKEDGLSWYPKDMVEKSYIERES